MRWQRIELTVETRQRFIFRNPLVTDWRLRDKCICGARMVTPEEAALMCGTGVREIYRRLDTSEIHFLETGTGALLICLNSFISARPAPDEVSEVVERHF